MAEPNPSVFVQAKRHHADNRKEMRFKDAMATSETIRMFKWDWVEEPVTRAPGYPVRRVYSRGRGRDVLCVHAAGVTAPHDSRVFCTRHIRVVADRISLASLFLSYSTDQSCFQSNLLLLTRYSPRCAKRHHPARYAAERKRSVGYFVYFLFEAVGGAYYLPLFQVHLPPTSPTIFIHFSTHFFNFKSAWFRKIKENHMRHHFLTNKYNFGLSTPLWDYVFFTIFRAKQVSKPQNTVASLYNL